MLEQKKVKENISGELNDIDNKATAQKEEQIQVDCSKQCCASKESNGNKAIKPTFVDTFKASIIDLIIIGGISIVGVFVVDAILRLSGYFITQKFQMSFVIFMVVMVLYMSIMESGKTSTTIGKKIAGLIITKG